MKRNQHLDNHKISINSSKETIPNKWTNEDLKTLLPMTKDALKYSSSYLRDNNNIWTDKIASMTNIDVNKMNISTFPRYFFDETVFINFNHNTIPTN